MSERPDPEGIRAEDLNVAGWKARLARQIEVYGRLTGKDQLIAKFITYIEELEGERATLTCQVGALLAEVRAWICAECRHVYLGPPQPGVKCIICLLCGAVKCMPLTTFEKVELAAKLADAEARERKLRGGLTAVRDNVQRVAWRSKPPTGDHNALIHKLATEALSALDATVVAPAEPAKSGGWLNRRPAVEALADALAPHMDAEEALSVAEWIVQNPEAAEAAAFDHYVSHDCAAPTQSPEEAR